MGRQSTLVGLLSPNEAWAELVGDLLAPYGYRCAAFRRAQSLATFVRLTPVHILLLDPHPQDISIMAAARYYRGAEAAFPLFKLIGMTSINEAFHRPLLASGLDGVIRKSVGSSALLRQIEVQREALHPRGNPRQHPPSTSSKQTDNVVSLFPCAASTRHNFKAQDGGTRAAPPKAKFPSPHEEPRPSS